MALIVLKKGGGRMLKAGGAWIYDNEIDSITGSFENGDLVTVRDFDGYMLGTGFINTHSTIAIRMMTRDGSVTVDDDFLKARMRQAWDYRKRVCDTTSCRLVFGEADFLPGLVIDKYEDILVLQVSALGMDKLKYRALSAMKEVLAEDGILIRGVYERSDGKYRDQEGIPRVSAFVGEPFDPKVTITENGVSYIVDVANGQKTGFFLDQKYNRLAIQKLCKDARVLDCFTHTGSFALNAGMAGAREVTGYDASELAVCQARENAALNHLEDTVRFEQCDVFDQLPRLEKAGELYDVVILDPPAFTKSKNSVKQAMKGYREINIRGMRLVRDGGYLATCSCSHYMGYELFTQMLSQAAASAHKRLRQVEYRTQSPDHPILWSADESYYLKFYIFQVLDIR